MDSYKITFTPKSGVNIDEEKALDLIDSLLGALNKSGQIVSWYDTIVKGNKYIARFAAYEKEGLKEKYNNEYVTGYYNKLDEYFDYSLTKDGYVPELSAPCKCKSPSWYYLRYNGIASGNSVVCGDCLRPFPVYKLPLLGDDKENYVLNNWENGYGGMEKLWFYGEYDPFCYRQMNSHKSKLTKDGLRICRDYEKEIKKPFYYYLYYFYSDEDGGLGDCPSCGEAWVSFESCGRRLLRCDTCRLITDA